MGGNRRNASTIDRGGFTLVELLVVVGLIAVLISILMPALNGARARARSAVCLSNLRQIALAATTYLTENKLYLLTACDGASTPSLIVLGTRNSTGASTGGWLDEIYRRCARKIEVLECPDQKWPRPQTGHVFQLLNEEMGSVVLLPRREYYPGYLQNTQVRTYTPIKSDPGPPAKTWYKPNRITAFKNPASKIWYADSGRQWENGAVLDKYSMVSSRGMPLFNHSEGAQMIGRHPGNKGNAVFLDGHAETLDPETVTCWGAAYQGGTPAVERAKFARYWDPDGDGDYLTPK